MCHPVEGLQVSFIAKDAFLCPNYFESGEIAIGGVEVLNFHEFCCVMGSSSGNRDFMEIH